MAQSLQPKWVKPLRLTIWLVVILLVAAGIGLYVDAYKTSAYITNTHDQKITVANYLLVPAIILGLQNLTLGVTRWFVRWREEKWSAGKVAGKLIGGGVWRTLVIVPIFLISLFILPSLLGGIIEQKSAEEFSEISSTDIDTPKRLLENAKENLRQMSEEEINKVLEVALLSKIDFDTDASSNLSVKQSLFAQNAFAQTTDMKILNKAKLSKDKHFVIFYTDTGEDAILDSDAEKVADILDQIVDSYYSELGLDFIYTKEIANMERESRAEKVLIANNIDKDALNFAMPVYIANPYETEDGILASYAGKKFNDIGMSILSELFAAFGVDAYKFYTTAATFPFINILPNNISNKNLSVVSAHELGHHYESTFCEASFGSDCDNMSTTARKIYNEGLANWFATMITKGSENKVIHNHHAWYIVYATCEPADKILSAFDGCISDDEILGYPATAFITNVYEAFDNNTGKSVLLNALNSDNFLQYLNSEIDRNFGTDADKKRYQIMQNLSERNLTNEYGDNYALYADYLPNSKELPCTDFCNEKYTVPYSAINYFAMAPSDYRDRKIIFKNENPNITASLIGKRNDKFEVISRTNYDEKYLEYQMNDDYEFIMLAVANADFQNDNDFSIKVEPIDIGELLEDDSESNCFDIGEAVDGMIGRTIKLTQIAREIVRSGGYEYTKPFDEAKSNLHKARTELKKDSITVCEYPIAPGIDFNTAFSSLRKTHTFETVGFSLSDGETQAGLSIGIDLVGRAGKVYLLVGDDAQLRMVSLNFSQK